MGWVHRRRDLGGVIFIDLRDRDGVTQVVFHEDVDPEVHERAEEVRAGVRDRGRRQGGAARRRTRSIPNMPTGEVEVVASKIWILNESRTPPFPMEEHVDVTEDVRLKYRYVDLRRPQHAAQHHPALEDRVRRARGSVRRRASSKSRRRS